MEEVNIWHFQSTGTLVMNCEHWSKCVVLISDTCPWGLTVRSQGLTVRTAKLKYSVQKSHFLWSGTKSVLLLAHRRANSTVSKHVSDTVSVYCLWSLTQTTSCNRFCNQHTITSACDIPSCSHSSETWSARGWRKSWVYICEPQNLLSVISSWSYHCSHISSFLPRCKYTNKPQQSLWQVTPIVQLHCPALNPSKATIIKVTAPAE